MQMISASDEHKSACILCSRNCGITVTVDKGAIIKVKGDPDHPTTKGYICQKAARLTHYQDNADRLSTPLKRTTDGSYEPISWDQALSEIAAKMNSVRNRHGGDAFALVGGGGQGNHLGGAYAQQLRYAMGKSRFVYSALAQEKTQDFWVNGRLFGDQRCHATEDVEHADYVLFIGCNPFQSHGIPNARDTLKQIKKDPSRTMVVVDPRFSETAKMADIHLQVKPGTDAYMMSAMLSIIVRENLHDDDFITKHCQGFDAVKKELSNISVDEYIAKADLDRSTVYQVARNFAKAKRGCVRIDLGIQQTLHSTLNAYLEKLLYLITGNFAKQGGNNLHTSFLPLLGNTDERRDSEKAVKRTAHHKMIPISGMYPPNILPDEIEHEGDDRLRAVWVESANPAMTYANSQAFERAFRKLDILVVVDVAMTETARLADYILPASSQFEKWEATGFNAEFPENFFHLRPPIFKPHAETLPEPEIYTRLLEKMGMIPSSFPVLKSIARYEPTVAKHQAYLGALMSTLKMNKELSFYAASILHQTLGKALESKYGAGAASAALLLPLSIDYANKYRDQVKRAGIQGNGFALGSNLFHKIMSSPSGIIISKHKIEEVWTLVKNKDQRVHLEIPEMLKELAGLDGEKIISSEYPLILMAGERRSYNANQIFRDPAWRKTDKAGSLRIHPVDAEDLNVVDKEIVTCRTNNGEIDVEVELNDTVRQGMITLPHGYGMRYGGSAPQGPQLNRLTSSEHCDPFCKTPYHKYVPAQIIKKAS